MIARTWHGVTPVEKADAYLAFTRERAIPDYEHTESNRGAYVLRRIDSDMAHFVTLSFWESEDAIRSFTGPETTNPKYYPEDDEYLIDREPTVTPYDAYTA